MNREQAVRIQKYFLDADAADRCKKLRSKNRFDIIGARIVALAEAGFIEGAGDLRMWRYSEVRLLPSGAGQVTAH